MRWSKAVSSNGQAHSTEQQYITIEELIRRVDASIDGMASSNPNRILLQQCRVAIVYLADRVPDERLTHQVVRP